MQQSDPDPLTHDLQAIIGGLQGSIDTLRERLHEFRPCYCGPERWARWRDGQQAGPDGIMGTADDVDLDDGVEP